MPWWAWVLVTTVAWGVVGIVGLIAVGLIVDRLTGRPQWTPQSYHRDTEQHWRIAKEIMP